MVQLKINTQIKEYLDDITWQVIADEYQSGYSDEILLVQVNGKLQELQEKIREGEVQFITARQKPGISAYQRSATLLMLKAFYAVAGPENVEKMQDRWSGKEFFSVSPLIQKRIDEWWKGKFFLYDNRLASASDEDSILSVFEYTARRYGCCVFLVDNLMTARFSASADRDFYRAQSNFTGRLVEFAKKNEVHVHLVAHPRKSQGQLDADDISGSGEITNRADNVFSLQRLTDEDADKQGYQAVLRVLKNRSFGASISLGLGFEESSRRFYKVGTGSPNKKYGWEVCGEQELVELPDETETPFNEKKS